MKKKNIINLIKYHASSDERAFMAEAYEVADDFYRNGDIQLAEYVMSLISQANTLSPQAHENKLGEYFSEIECDNSALLLPEVIKSDIIGVVNAISRHMGINKILLEGAPGSGKTESVKQVARILDRKLYKVEVTSIIDSRLGQTAKNVETIFSELNQLKSPSNIIILIDEIDALALDRIRGNDLREMGRVATTLFQELDNLDEEVVLFATTNLFKIFDQALARRFDYIINFDRYSREDLLEISESILEGYLKKVKSQAKDKKLFHKVMALQTELPYPGDLRNLIKTAVAFSDPNDEYGYLKILYERITKTKVVKDRIKDMAGKGFTIREIEKLSGISKSQIARSQKNE